MALDKCDCFIISVEVIRVILGVRVARFNRAVSAILTPLQELFPHSVIVQRERNTSVLYIVVSKDKLPAEVNLRGVSRIHAKAALTGAGCRVM